MFIYVITVSSQECNIGVLDPWNVNSYDSERLVPLLRRYTDTLIPSPEQWIFPNLQFTCYGTLTTWIFTGVPGQTLCGADLETWQLDTSSITRTIYERQSTTERNTVIVRRDGPMFIYELATPVLVQPGDIVGVGLGLSCARSESFDNVLSYNISGTGSSYLSYRQDRSGSTFFLQSSSITIEQDLVPLIGAVVSKLTVICIVVVSKLTVNVHISYVHCSS